SIDEQVANLRRFVQDQAARIVVHGGVVLGLIALLSAARRRARGWTTGDTLAPAAASLLAQPVAAALVLGLPLGFWIYAREPRAGLVFVELGLVVPLVVVLRRLLPAPVVPALYRLSGFFLFDRLRDLTTPLPLVERVLFLAEAFAATAFLGWALWSRR